MGRYINWGDVIARHPSLNSAGGASDVGSAWVGHVENQLDGMLTSHYTVPFSSNNETIKDLSIELMYLRVGNLKIKESDSLKKGFMGRIANLKNGSESMLTSSGDIISAIGDTFYSSTEDYDPVFDLGPTLEMGVDSMQSQDIYDAKF